MPRNFSDSQPKIINKVGDKDTFEILQISTGNKNKIKEFQRLIPNKKIEGVKLKIDEIQSLNPYEVVEKKAIEAFEKNEFNPILVEDSSIDINGLGGRPGTLADFFIADIEIRRLIVETWLKDKDRKATARAILAIYDGNEVHTFEGVTTGTISFELREGEGFGYDDIFIPDGQKTKEKKTFSELGPVEKDKLSPRKKAVDNLLNQELLLGDYVYEMPEPFSSEISRVKFDELSNKKAVKFAYSLEAIQGSKPNKNFKAEEYSEIKLESNDFYQRYLLNPNSQSIGIVITDVDKAKGKLKKNGKPVLWQMGPERRQLALAQRAHYFINNTNNKIYNILSDIETKKIQIPQRSNKKSNTVETLLHGNTLSPNSIYARAVKELGYKKITSKKEVSRTLISKYGLFNKIGKYPRSYLCIGSMPAVSGWRDVIVTAAIGHMPIFISRNNIFAGNIKRRINLINEAKSTIQEIGMDKESTLKAFRNIGIAIGTSNPKEELKQAKEFYTKAGIKLFRIYTINGDPRCIEIAKMLRKEFGDSVEIFAGQLTDRYQAEMYVSEAQVDGIIFGHGGGRQCTSAINGMAITTVEEVYSLVTDRYYNDTTLLIEGGVGRNVGPLLLLGVDGIIYNQQLTRGCIETGGIFLQNREGEYGQPYHGSASAPTMIIEAANPDLYNVRIDPSGRTKVPEGKPGFTLYTEKANSMTFWIGEFRHHLARTLADLGVESIWEMRHFLQKADFDLLRIVTPEAAKTAGAWRNRGQS